MDHIGDDFDRNFNKLFKQLEEVKQQRDLRNKENSGVPANENETKIS
jgi:hypothetical protein